MNREITNMPLTNSFLHRSEEQTRIEINVSGVHFETYESTLARFPTTLLGCAERRQEYYDARTGVYFFNRNRCVFEAILFFYQSYGRLSRPQHVPMREFERECRFFDLPKDNVEQMKALEGVIMLEEIKNKQVSSRWRRMLWDILHHPDAGRVPFVYGCISMAVIACSVLLTCIETLPSLKRHADVWYGVDLGFATWFSIEYVSHFYSAPNRIRYIRSPLSIMDLLSSIVYLIVLLVDNQLNLSFLRVFRLARLIRILRLTSDTNRIELLSHVIISTLPDLFRLFLCLMMTVILGASLLYLTERDVPGSQFTSIPASGWWALQTVIVLGYGDMVPSTLEGKLIAAAFMVFGVLVFSLPVLSVVSKLSRMYDYEKNDD